MAKTYNYLGNPAFPLTKETDTTYGGSKIGKAPTQKTPAAPDPFKLIEEQSKANRPNQEGPLGSLRYTKDPTTGFWTETREYSPELQGLFDQRIGMVGEDISRAPTDESFAGEGQRLENATYEKLTNLLNPNYEQQEQALRSDLANKGITEGSEAYNRELDNFARRRGESYRQAALESVGTGRQEQGRLFTQGLQSRQSDLARRSQLYNELASLIGTQQIRTPTELDVMGPFSQQYQGQLGQVRDANANAAQRNSQTTTAAASLASALLAMFSDRRLKTDIEKVGELPSGLNLYRYRYLWEQKHRIGVMADEVETLFPEAVGEMYGYKTVDYGRIH